MLEYDVVHAVMQTSSFHHMTSIIDQTIRETTSFTSLPSKRTSQANIDSSALGLNQLSFVS
jgi:hypothetical protein